MSYKLGDVILVPVTQEHDDEAQHRAAIGAFWYECCTLATAISYLPCSPWAVEVMSYEIVFGVGEQTVYCSHSPESEVVMASFSLGGPASVAFPVTVPILVSKVFASAVEEFEWKDQQYA